MSNICNFLITYGLHNYVTHANQSHKHVFTIKGRESQKMVSHAQNLIKGNFGEAADIKIA